MGILGMKNLWTPYKPTWGEFAQVAPRDSVHSEFCIINHISSWLRESKLLQLLVSGWWKMECIQGTLPFGAEQKRFKSLCDLEKHLPLPFALFHTFSSCSLFIHSTHRISSFSRSCLGSLICALLAGINLQRWCSGDRQLKRKLWWWEKGHFHTSWKASNPKLCFENKESSSFFSLYGSFCEWSGTFKKHHFTSIAHKGSQALQPKLQQRLLGGLTHWASGLPPPALFRGDDTSPSEPQQSRGNLLLCLSLTRRIKTITISSCSRPPLFYIGVGCAILTSLLFRRHLLLKRFSVLPR